MKTAVRRAISALFILFALCSPTLSSQVIQTAAADLDRDGTVEHISITCTKVTNGHPMGGEIIISHEDHGKLRANWQLPNLNPWKFQIGDVDGDGHKELVVGVWKKSRYDPIFAKRTFVYSWNGKRLLPRWLGSRLSKRFTDFALCQLDGDRKTELVALEKPINGKFYVSAYRWQAFGFDWIGRAGPIQNATSLRVHGKSVIVLTKSGALSSTLVRGKLVLNKFREAKT